MDQQLISQEQVCLLPVKGFSKDQDQSTENSSKGDFSQKSAKKIISVSIQPTVFVSKEFYSSILQSEAYIQLDSLPKCKIPSQQKQEDSALVQRQSRLIKEVNLMRKNLPIYETNSIFVRGSEKIQSHQQALITGSEDTPYAFGCFLFDILYPEQFPQVPPSMQILTTGNGSLRFNPNLYNSGYVCLSLLGTWSGQEGENWDPAISTSMHILMSIQSIVMCNDVFFQEPGYVGMKGQANYEKLNLGYQNIVRYGTIRFAMNEMLLKPPQGFENAIRMHFYLNKNKILSNVDKWLQNEKDLVEQQNDNYLTQYKDLVYSHNPKFAQEFSQKRENYYTQLSEQIQILKNLLNQITYREMYRNPEFRKIHLQINQSNTLNNSIITPEEKPKILVQGIRKIAQQKKIKRKQKFSRW